MLPHTPDLGISETFGSTTIGKADFANESISLDFAKEYSEIPRRLAVLISTHRKIWNLESVSKNKDDTLVSKSNNSDPLDKKIIKDNSTWIHNKSNKIKDNNSRPLYNPCVSKTCKIFKLGSGAYTVITSGQDNNTLIFGRLDSKWNGWKLLKDKRRFSELQHEAENVRYDDIQGRNDDEHDDEDLKSPRFNWVRSLTLKSQILGIETYSLDPHTALVLIRTSDTVYVLRVTIHNSLFLLNRVFQFKQGETWASFAHSSLYVSSRLLRLCITDCVGKFIVFKSDSLKKIIFEKVNLKFESFYNPTELSDFKKSIWLDSGRLILFSRTQLYEYSFDISLAGELRLEKFVCRVAAGIWSKFLDIVPSPGENDVYYILTTKEIILVDAYQHFKRKLAWKHFFNDQDTTMHLNVIRTPRNMRNDICIVSSKNSLINYAMEFNSRDFRIVNNPYIFYTDLKTSPISTDIYQFNTKLYLNIILQKQENGEVTFDLLKYTSFHTDDEKYGPSPELQDNSKVFMKYSFIVPLHKKEAANLFDRLIDYYKFDGIEAPDSNEVTDAIYGKLKEFIDDEIVSFKSLYQMIGDIHIPRNIKNIFKIVNHLVKNKDDEEYSVHLNQATWLTDNMTLSGIYSEEDEIHIQADQIIKFFEDLVGKSDKHITADVTLYLLLSLIELRKNSKTLEGEEIENQISELAAELPEDYANIVDTFETDANVVGIMDSEDEEEIKASNPYSNLLSVPTVMSSQVPQIGLSQPTRSSQNANSNKSSPVKKKTLLSSSSSIFDTSFTGFPSPSSQQLSDTETQTQSQRTLSQPGFSQSQSKGPKKKKRRAGGFM